MLLIRRILRGANGITHLAGYGLLSRRYFSHSSTLLNRTKSSSKSDSANSLEDNKVKIQKEKKQAKTLDQIIKIETTEAPKPPAETLERRLSPLEFMNQGRSKIPENWRKDQMMPEWKRQKYALGEKFKGKAWNPVKKLSRDEMESVRMLKRELPDMTSKDLSDHFKISPEAVRRILKSKWTPSLEEEEDIYERWKKRGEKIKNLYIEKYGTDTKVIIKNTGDGSGVRAKFDRMNKRSKSSSKRGSKDGSKPKRSFRRGAHFDDVIF